MLGSIRRLVVVVGALALVATGCGGDDGGESHQGELFGALSVTKPPNETLTPTEASSSPTSVARPASSSATSS